MQSLIGSRSVIVMLTATETGMLMDFAKQKERSTQTLMAIMMRWGFAKQKG
jgi:hypothetical protein